jgi:hypothetical protein
MVSAAGFELELVCGRERGEGEREAAGEIPSVARDLFYKEFRAYMVSAAGFEPATHALKGRCSTN